LNDSSNTDTGTLYIVATPIGNLEDITMRAVRVLGEVACIASEDTRRTKILLKHFDIKTQLISYYREKEAIRSDQIIGLLEQGKDIALVSDAGTPCISDPGTVLIEKAHKRGIRVSPVPGASALTAALSLSGMLSDTILFLGFPPNRKSARRKVLLSLKNEPHLLVFYESPKRIIGCLQDIYDIFGDRNVFVVRELTKIHEEYFSGAASSVIKSLSQKDVVKGEFVVILEGGAGERAPDCADIHQLIQWYKKQGDLSLSDSVKKISKDIGVAKAKVYKEALKIWD
jgi:16S rRNA (cytidine1402-2'-O)-methyltransferase